MKTLAEHFGKNTEIAIDEKDVKELNVPSREGGQGLPNSDFYVMPLIGKTSFTIGEKTHTPTTICVAYKDRTGKDAFRMVSAASFGRSARDKKGETTDAKTIPLVENEITEPIFTLRPAEIISTFKGKVCKIVDTKVLFFPVFADDKPDWENAESKQTTLRKMQADAKGYEAARKAFDKFAKEQGLENAVKAIEAA